MQIAYLRCCFHSSFWSLALISFTTPTYDAAWRRAIMSTCCQDPKGKSAPLGVSPTTNDKGRAWRSRLRDSDASVNRFRRRAPCHRHSLLWGNRVILTLRRRLPIYSADIFRVPRHVSKVPLTDSCAGATG